MGLCLGEAASWGSLVWLALSVSDRFTVNLILDEETDGAASSHYKCYIVKGEIKICHLKIFM